MHEQNSTKKSRRRARIADADERIKNNTALRPAMKMFNDSISYGPIKKRASKLSPGNKIIFTATETNEKRH